MGTDETYWVARIAPTAALSLESLLQMPLGLDVWEREENALVVAASESQLCTIEERRLAHVERISTLAGFVEQARRRAGETKDEERRGPPWP